MKKRFLPPHARLNDSDKTARPILFIKFIKQMKIDRARRLIRNIITGRRLIFEFEK